MKRTITIICPTCKGSGEGKEAPICADCLGSGKIDVNPMPPVVSWEARV